MVAYAITNGEGTLLDYGIADYIEELADFTAHNHPDAILFVGPVERDPETGQ
jgi:hypothetical protein